jgi:hypothetical protein
VLPRLILIVAISTSIFLITPMSGEVWSDTIDLGALSKIYEPMKFTHDKHMEIESNCNACHHHSKQGETRTCASCHSAGNQGTKKKNIVGLKDAYHGLCINCHKKTSGPAKCSECHTKKTKKFETIDLKKLSNIYKAVKFSHGKHIDIVADCTSCHHYSESGAIPSCASCHEAIRVYQYKVSGKKAGLGLKGAYHGLCIDCHKKTSGPAGCNECHKRKTGEQ